MLHDIAKQTGRPSLTPASPTVGVTFEPLLPLGQHQRPGFLRLPRAGRRCPVTGLSRAALNALILGHNLPVKSSCLRQKGSLRGIRLVSTASLLAHLYANMEGNHENVRG